MATDVTLMVLPSFMVDEAIGRPRIFVERNGTWRDFSILIGSNVSQIWRDASAKLNDLMAKWVKHQSLSPWGFVETICYDDLYAKVVPKRLQEELRAAADTGDDEDVPILRIHTPIDWIPWELMHDGTDYLGLRFQIARLPIGATGPELNGQERSVQRIYNLLARNLFKGGGIPTAWSATFSGLVASPAQEIRFPSAGGPGNDFPELEDLAQAQAPDILHVTCHGGQVDEKDGKVYWTLDDEANIQELVRIKDGNWKTWGQTKDIFGRQPLVFGNACASVEAYDDAHASAQGDASASAELDSGFGPLLFAHGAAAFVGTLIAISEDLSVKFARQFYEHLLGDELPIGKALWKTKKHFAKKRQKPEEGGNDPSWLFYCLYGPPETRFKIAD